MRAPRTEEASWTEGSVTGLDAIRDGNVAVSVGDPRYDARAPFSPEAGFPEYPFAGKGACAARNAAYPTVRAALQLLGMDADHFGSRQWNPLGRLIQPGHTVVLKPNFVRHFRESHPNHGDCLITHGAVIRAMLDYVYIALAGRGRVIIADAPQDDGDFDTLREIAGLDAIRDFYRRQADFDVEVLDLRQERSHKVDGVICGHIPLPGDPAGYATPNLGMDSAFAEVNELCHLLYGAKFDMEELHRHHHGDVHEYPVSRTVLGADCVINLPKLKTHKKTGVTLSMKNLVGINGNKNWLPHHREGTPAQDGDQFPDDRLKRRLERACVRAFRKLFPLLGPLRSLLARPVQGLGKRVFGDTNVDTIRSGNWFGNDTTWRMVADLARIFLYADENGCLHGRPVRRCLNIVDGIVAGEGNGPLDPTPKACGVILAGTNPVAVDLACARLMGFDACKIPLLRHAMEAHRYPLNLVRHDDIRCLSNDTRYDRMLSAIGSPALRFQPHFGWKGHVELQTSI